MITTSRFPHGRFLMKSGGSRIVSVHNQTLGIVTEYPAPKSLRRLIGAICMCAAGVSVVALVLVGVL